MGATGKPRGDFVPAGFKSRIEALTWLIRFGPARLSSSEFLVLLFLVERTLIYGKRSDAASLSQITDGIRRKDGIWIRGGAGVNRSTAAVALAQLDRRGLVKRRPNNSARRGHQATEYEIQWPKLIATLQIRASESPLVRISDKGGSEAQQKQPSKLPLVRISDKGGSATLQIQASELPLVRQTDKASPKFGQGFLKTEVIIQRSRNTDYQPTNRTKRDSPAGVGQHPSENRFSQQDHNRMAAALGAYGRHTQMRAVMNSEPPDAIVSACLEAADGISLQDVLGILQHRQTHGYEPGTKKGPKKWAWFVAVIRRAANERRQVEEAGRKPVGRLDDYEAPPVDSDFEARMDAF